MTSGIIQYKDTLMDVVGQPTWNGERDEGEEDKEEERDVIMCAWVVSLSLSSVCTEQISVYVWLVL